MVTILLRHFNLMLLTFWSLLGAVLPNALLLILSIFETFLMGQFLQLVLNLNSFYAYLHLHLCFIDKYPIANNTYPITLSFFVGKVNGTKVKLKIFLSSPSSVHLTRLILECLIILLYKKFQKNHQFFQLLCN